MAIDPKTVNGIDAAAAAAALFGQTSVEATQPAGAGATRTKRPKQTEYVNVGLNLPIPQADGTVVTKFVSLPFGIAMDNVEPMEATGSNVEWANMVAAKNFLLNYVRTELSKLAPGEESMLSGLEVQVKRAPTSGVPAQNTGENPLLAAMAAKLAPATAPAANSTTTEAAE